MTRYGEIHVTGGLIYAISRFHDRKYCLDIDGAQQPNFDCRKGFGLSVFLVVLLIVNWSACSVTEPSPPRYPAAPDTWTVPLFEPLTRRLPTVTVRPGFDHDRLGSELLAVVDTGSSITELPTLVVSKAEASGGSVFRARSRDASGRIVEQQVVVMPFLEIGRTLTVRDVAVADNPRFAVLGAGVFENRCLGMNLDDGVLQVGGPPPETISIQRLFHVPVVSIPINGRQVRMLIDTGGLYSLVNRKTQALLGGERHVLEQEVPLRSSFGQVLIKETFDADIEIGDEQISGRIAIYDGPRIEGIDGVLGWDLLSQYEFDLSDEAFHLRRRTDLLSARDRRLARWGRRFPQCPEMPGCVEASLNDDIGQIDVHIRRAFAEGVALLFACRNRKDALDSNSMWVRVDLHRAQNSGIVTAKLGAPRQMVEIWQKRCTDLTLIDINPLDGGRSYDAAVQASAHFQMDRRRIVLR